MGIIEFSIPEQNRNDIKAIRTHINDMIGFFNKLMNFTVATAKNQYLLIVHVDFRNEDDLDKLSKDAKKSGHPKFTLSFGEFDEHR